LTRLRANIVANFGGSLVAGVMGLLFIPLYIRLMGIEPYGLVGFFLTMQSILGLLDAGLSTTLNREFARLSLNGGDFPRMRRLLRTLESIYWLVALGAGGLMVLLSRWIAVNWVRPHQLSVRDVAEAVVLMGFAFTVLWPLSLYSGGMQGLQRQVALNVINAAAATCRGVGGALVLWLISPTVQAYFIWQIVVGVLHTAAVAIALWKRVGGTEGAGFDPPLLRSVWRFAAGLTAISFLSAAITQLDRVILSRVLPLAAFGYYAFAATAAASMYRLISPIFAAIFPRFAQLAAEGDERELASLYHRSAEGIALAVLPAAIFVAFFSHEVLLLWTRDPAMARNTGRILSFLIVGTAVNGLLTIPYAVQLAYGWTRLVIGMNLIAVAVLVPLVLFLTRQFGAPGAAFGWLAYNTIAGVIVPMMLHARVLRGELSRWYLHDVGAPLAASIAIAFVARSLVPVSSPDVFALLLRLAPVALCMQLGAVLVVPRVRRRIFGRVTEQAA
jgi:O-antigen/teichoic acid export membrane protein